MIIEAEDMKQKKISEFLERTKTTGNSFAFQTLEVSIFLILPDSPPPYDPPSRLHLPPLTLVGIDGEMIGKRLAS